MVQIYSFVSNWGLDDPVELVYGVSMIYNWYGCRAITHKLELGMEEVRRFMALAVHEGCHIFWMMVKEKLTCTIAAMIWRRIKAPMVKKKYKDGRQRLWTNSRKYPPQIVFVVC
jgi:hypothetical protein